MASAATDVGLREATLRGLQREPKQLPTVWLYDERGSQLYEEITRLPEYYLPRREREILRARSSEIAARTRARTLVELGAGNAQRTRARWSSSVPETRRGRVSCSTRSRRRSSASSPST